MLASESCFLILPTPGSMPIRLDMPPILRSCRSCEARSSRSKLPFCILRASFSASSWSTVSAAFSTRPMTSPMSRMRPAMRSAWKGSSASSFSPKPTNLIGLPVIAHRDHFEHQLLVGVEAAGSVENDDIVAFEPPDLERAPGDGDGPLAGDDRQARDAGLAAENGELLLRRRAVDVERGEQDLLLVAVLETQRQLRRARRLARALEPDHHEDRRRRRAQIEPAIVLA